MSSPVLSVRISAGYGKTSVLNDLAFDLLPGERLGLLGPSGTGKSTLLLALLGLLPRRGGWARGEVRIGGRDILALSQREARKVRGRDFALVPQSPLSALNSAISLQKHFEHCWKAHSTAGKAELQERMTQLLERVQLPSHPDFLRRKPAQISVGQAQRAVLALALLHRPLVVIADEPTSSLDPVTQTEVIDLLRDTTEQQGTALLFVSHDLMSVLRLCSEVAILSEGRLAERFPTHEIVTARTETLRSLLRALPVPAHVLLQHVSGASEARLHEEAPLRQAEVARI